MVRERRGRRTTTGVAVERRRIVGVVQVGAVVCEVGRWELQCARSLAWLRCWPPRVETEKGMSIVSCSSVCSLESDPVVKKRRRSVVKVQSINQSIRSTPGILVATVCSNQPGRIKKKKKLLRSVRI